MHTFPSEAPSGIETDRLILRAWTEKDYPAFAALNADPKVREFYPNILSQVESDTAASRIQQSLQEKGYGLWAVEVKNGAPFIGYVGLSMPTFQAAFAPCVEIGWRLAYTHWGKGYATEAAMRVLEFGFQTLKLPEIVSFTVPANNRSLHVMERIGMKRDPSADFEHPLLPDDSPLKQHVLYRIRRDEFLEAQAAT